MLKKDLTGCPDRGYRPVFSEAAKNEEVVRVAVSKMASPMKVAIYKTRLIDRKLLKARLHALPSPEKK